MPANELLSTASLALAIFALGSIWFGRFEIETPRWRRTLKLVLLTAIACGVTAVFGSATGIGFLATMLVAGTTFHFLWCRRNRIDPWTAEPWERYRALRGWVR